MRLDHLDDKKRAHTERSQSMKESRLLKEGPGAGYTISAEIKIASIENIKLGKPVTLDGDFTGIEFTCDGKATATKITAESYAFGDTITGTFDVSFSKGVALEPSDIAESLIKECVGTTITTNTIYGGGWSHSTYDGTLTHSLDDTNSYVYVYFTDMKLESNDIINYIDKAVTGENIITWYEVQDSEGEPVYNGDYFENSDDAVKFAKNNDTAVRVIEWTDIEDFYGDIDSYDDPRVIWQKRTFENASRKSTRFKLSEMTQSELDAAKKEFQGKLRKRLGTDNLFSTYSQWTEEEKTEDTKFDCISMINSILAYDWNYKDSAETVLQNDLEGYHSYLKKYIDLLGRDTVINLIQNQMDDIEAVDKDTFSDSEGVAYNSIRWKRENLNTVKKLSIKENLTDEVETLRKAAAITHPNSERVLIAILAERVADIATEMGDDYSEWLDRFDLQDITLGCLENMNFYTKFDENAKKLIEHVIQFIRSEEDYYDSIGVLENSPRNNNHIKNK